MNFQALGLLAAVLDKTHLAKTVHEKADSGAGSADNFGQRLLAYLWDYQLRFAFLPEIGQQEQYAGEPLLAGVEQLVYQILLDPNVAGEQMVEQQFGKGRLVVKYANYAGFLHPHDRTIRQGGGAGHTHSLTGPPFVR